jgi:predicted ArsR family transcriptional regulator
MLLTVFNDLVKPQWRAVLEELKLSGETSVGDLARRIGGSYMAAKTHCEELTGSGYLVRTRLPRAAVGRPEIFYSLSSKADALFPQAGADFTLELLEGVRQMFGESAPEKLLFQYFQKQSVTLSPPLAKLRSIEEKAVKLSALRTRQGCAGFCKQEPGQPLRIIELHNPLQRVFEHYPRASTMEVRMLEELLQSKITRRELASGRKTTPCVVFEIHRTHDSENLP